MTAKKNSKSKLQAPPVTPAVPPPVADSSTPTVPAIPAAAVEPGERPAAAAGSRFPIVGIGASAGGLAAFAAFFSSMPQDILPGMAFVLVQHLDPNHKSLLCDLIQRYTNMTVLEVEDGMVVRPNHAYIIPPNRDMALLNGALHLLEPAAPRGQRLPIDFFFRSLAQDQHERAIAIVLSGTGSDGTLGGRTIKGVGGMVMVQSPSTAEYDGMPRSVLAAGLADFELPPGEMPAKLVAYATHALGLPLIPPEDPPPIAESALRKIFILLRVQTGHDFSQYKSSTIHRRIERRMAVQQIEMLDGYVKFLQQTPAEVEALFRDLLIGVTNFFRDPDVFLELEQRIIPKLFADKPANGLIRVWVPGCSTGEEAYSIAILLVEQLEVLRKGYKVQIFATDIDSRAIATARSGCYPSSIAADVSPARLSRFFTLNADGTTHRIHKGLRDMVVFSEQDVTRDPPFSKLDLISCRNMLIYMGGDLQKRLIPLFHYALNPGGVLFLGTSETVGDFANLFEPLDRKAKLYQRRQTLLPRAGLGRILPVLTALEVALPRDAAGKAAVPIKKPLRELAEQALLRQLAPIGALVNEHGDVLYLHGRTGMYLEPTPGEAGTNNILKMAREGLRHELTTTLHRAVTTKESVHRAGVRVKTNGHFTLVNLAIRPVTDSNATAEAPLYLVVMEEVPADDSTPPPVAGDGTDYTQAHADAHIAVLKQELLAKEEYLQSTNEELETSNEELKSSNEEMQSVNEELQSTNEELETSKEELQSVNEELATVNAELQAKVLDLSRANDDMNNLLAGTGIATVFVDHRLRILRFTPGATSIINLILGDMGRPVGHILSNLVGYNSLVADVQSVLDTLIPKDLEVQAAAGRWYMMHIQPYRTVDNVIEGAVITFADITEMKAVAAMLAKANAQLRLAVVVRDAHDAITVQDLEGRTIAWNPGAVRMYGWSEDEALAMNVHDRIPPELREGALNTLVQLSQAEILKPYRTRRINKAGASMEVSIVSTALVDESGKLYAFATTERAITRAEG